MPTYQTDTFRYDLLFPGTGLGQQMLGFPRNSLSRDRRVRDKLVAEGVGFEPTRATRTPLVFETSALNRSAIPPDPQNRLPKPEEQGNISREVLLLTPLCKIKRL